MSSMAGSAPVNGYLRVIAIVPEESKYVVAGTPVDACSTGQSPRPELRKVSMHASYYLRVSSSCFILIWGSIDTHSFACQPEPLFHLRQHIHVGLNAIC